MIAPGISVLVPTYGRTRVLTECIESFLRQDYGGQAELIVLNDHPEQTLHLDTSVETRDDRRVSIINAPQRYDDLGAKRNALVGMASNALVAFWDDDDIYLPSALTRVAERYLARAPIFRSGRESHCWQMQPPGGNDGVSGRISLSVGIDIIIRDSGPLWAMVMERGAINDVGGFPPYDRMQDVELLRKLIQRRWVASEANTPGIPSCIHRLAGTPYTHAIDFAWKAVSDNPASAEFHARATTALMDRGEEPRGDVTIQPAWLFDYVALTTAAWTFRNAQRTLPRESDSPSA